MGGQFLGEFSTFSSLFWVKNSILFDFHNEIHVCNLSEYFIKKIILYKSSGILYNYNFVDITSQEILNAIAKRAS